MTPLECLQYLMDLAGDIDDLAVGPEVREGCNKIRSILEAVEILQKFHSALNAPNARPDEKANRDFPVYPLMPADVPRRGYWPADEMNEYLKKILACS